MSTSSLTSKALARLHAMVEGNGMEASAISVARTDEAIYTLNAELTITPRYEIGVATPQELKRLPAERLANSEALRALAAARTYPNGWVHDALNELRELPAEGWGVDGKALRLDQHTRLFTVAEKCQHCGGAGAKECNRCNRTGIVDCDNCLQGRVVTGIEPNTEDQPCRICFGRKEVQCRTCNGNGRIACAACRGKGEAVTTYAVKLYADLRFAWTDNGVELPTPLRRAVDRAGIAKLANGHADIVRGDVIEESNPPRVAYTATLPFATVWFMIDGQKHMAQVLGNKVAILELHDFLDEHIAAAEQNGTLGGLRIYGEAQLIRARAGTLNDLMRNYPAGLSKNMADHILRLAGQKLRQQTRGPRWISVGAGVGISAALMALYFFAGLQNIINPGSNSMMVDVGFMLALCAAFVFGQRFYIKHVLEKQLGQKGLRPPYFARHVVAGVLGIVLLFALMVWISTPVWLQIDKLLVEAYIRDWQSQHP